MDKKHGEYKAIIQRILGSDLPTEEKVNQLIKTDRKNKYDIYKTNNCVATSYPKGEVDFQEYVNCIKTCIKNKTKKLNNDYLIFNENWLYIFTDMACIQKDDLSKILDFCKSELNFKVCFNKIFINCIDRIFIINTCLKENNIKILNISHNGLVYLKTASKK